MPFPVPLIEVRDHVSGFLHLPRYLTLMCPGFAALCAAQQRLDNHLHMPGLCRRKTYFLLIRAVWCPATIGGPPLTAAPCTRRDLMDLCAAQQQYAPRQASLVFGGASGAQISATITSIQAWLP